MSCASVPRAVGVTFRGVQATAEHVFGDSLFASTDLGSENDGAADAINVLSLALWLFAGVTAIVGAVAIAIILTREIAQTGVDQTTLQSLGMTRGVRTMVGAFVAGVVALIGIAMAVGPCAGDFTVVPCRGRLAWPIPRSVFTPTSW